MGVSAVDFLLLVVGVRSYSPENMNESCLEVWGVVVDLLHHVGRGMWGCRIRRVVHCGLHPGVPGWGSQIERCENTVVDLLQFLAVDRV